MSFEPAFTIHFNVGDAGSAGYFATLGDAEMFWEILQPMYEQGRVTQAAMFTGVNGTMTREMRDVA